MPTRASATAAIAAVLAAVLLAVVCGGSPGPSEASSTTTTTTPLTGAAALGEETFNKSCVACHGPGGEGIEGLGKPLPESDFLRGLTDEEALAFIIAGRPSDDPLNTTGIAMPPRAGNPSLTDEELANVVAYLRVLQAEA